jgi:hypothetical protein
MGNTGSVGRSEQVKQVASTATDRAGDVVAEARDQARYVGREAKDQAREVADRARQEMREQAQARSQQAAASLRTLGDRLNALASGDAQSAGPLVDYLREGQDKVATLASRLESGPDEVLDELRQFARRKPMVFLASAGLLGFVAGRLVRSASSDGSNDSNTETALVPMADSAVVMEPELAGVPTAGTPTGMATPGTPVTSGTAYGDGAYGAPQ